LDLKHRIKNGAAGMPTILFFTLSSVVT